MADKQLTSNRDGFTSRWGFILACIGSAVGMGNIWRFPIMVSVWGGMTFLIPYFICVLLIGSTGVIGEFALGRATGAGPIGAFGECTALRGNRKIGEGIGLIPVIGSMALAIGYTVVMGWIFKYTFISITGDMHAMGQDMASIGGHFDVVAVNNVPCIIVAILASFAIMALGVSGGIEKATRILIPLLFVLLVVVCIRSLTLPNAMEGLKFLFMPDFSRIDGSVVLMAMGLAFFKMSIGFGCMITYGSYFRSDTHVPFLAVRVMVCDLLVSILAGIAVFPAVFSFGFEPTAGTSLLFLTIPAVFASMPGGQLFTTLFFVLSAVASMGAMLSLLEVPVAWLSETFRISRPRATVLMTLALILLGAPATLSTSVLSDVTVFGLSLFDLYDFLSSNLMLPLDGLLLSLFVGYVWSRSDALDALTNGGTLHNLACAKAILFLCRYVTPILIVIILLNGLKVF